MIDECISYMVSRYRYLGTYVLEHCHGCHHSVFLLSAGTLEARHTWTDIILYSNEPCELQIRVL